MSRDSRDIQAAVRARVVGKVRVPDLPRQEVVDAIVWETLALLGEWDLIALVPLNDETRKALG